MNKFWILLKKELRELITLQTMIGIIVGVVVLIFVGKMMGEATSKKMDKIATIGIVDLDQSELSENMVAFLEQGGFEVVSLSGSTAKGNEPEILKQAEQEGLSGYLLIPEGMEQSVTAKTSPQIQLVSKMESMAISSMGSSSVLDTAFELMNQYLSSQLMENQGLGADQSFLKSPLEVQAVTVVGENSSNISSDVLKSFSMQQSMFVPIIVFLLITYAVQMVVSSVASEKNDKTLETLLSAPVSRLAVLGSKMCAAGLLSLLMAAVYMIGFSQYMGGMMGDSSYGDENSISEALRTLGLTMQGADYILLGLQMFLTILIALAISVVIGALSKDVKSAQGLVAPVMFMAMIPYFVTLLSDVSDLPVVAQVIINLIPFTHTFSATTNLIFENQLAFFGGMAYQFVLLCVVMFFAVKIFSTDKIFTMTISFDKKSTGKKKTQMA